jgi:Zn-dependent peptidase ImmA (M78 family)
MKFLSKKQKEILRDFVKFVKNELKIESMPRILILNGRGDLKTTANYDYRKPEKIMKINGRNRATVDIMRSIAHELTHHKQYEQGRLNVRPPDIGGEIEDEANAKAGQFIKMFAKKQPEIYELDEQEDTTSPGAGTSGTAGTSSTGEKKGYPEVTKWSDGYKINRDGPANQLK